ncbi:MAG: hypothetical protein Q9222_007135 [Ikaeria aurantiellina]
MAGHSRSTPPGQPPTLKKSSSSSQSSKNQKSIMGFFQKKPSGTPTPALVQLPTINGSVKSAKASSSAFSTKVATRGPSSSLTPAPSSDAMEEPEDLESTSDHPNGLRAVNGLPSPITPASMVANGEDAMVNGSVAFNSPSRKAKKVINYAESGDEEDEDDAFNPSLPARGRGRAPKRRKTSPTSDTDDFDEGIASDLEALDEGKPSEPTAIAAQS